MKLLSDAKILAVVSEKAGESRVHLTSAERIFFVFLLKLIAKKGTVKEGFSFASYDVRGLASMAKRSNTFVSEALSKFVKCGLIIRVPCDDSLVRNVRGKRPLATGIDLSLFERKAQKGV